MKKLKEILAIFVMCITCVLTLAGCACNNNKIVEMSLKSGFRTTYLVDEEINYDDMKIAVVYKDGTEETIGKDQFTYEPISTEAPGTYDLKVTYKEAEKKFKITVTRDKDAVYQILTPEHNKNYVQYESALKALTGDESEETLEGVFTNRVKSDETIYVVGDDNPFTYNLRVTALDTNGLPVAGGLQASKTVTTVYYKSTYDGTYTKLTEEQVPSYVEVYGDTSSYQFKTLGYYKLEIRPFYLTDEQLLTPDVYTKTIEIKVVDGYNVTEAYQLGMLYNVSETTTYTYENNTRNPVNLYEAWGEFLNEKEEGIVIKNINAIVLHNDITVTGADIPTAYLDDPRQVSAPLHTIEEEATNEKALYIDENGHKKVLVDQMSSPKCGGTNIYCHQVTEGTPFTFYGNFFTLKAQLPTVDTNILPDYGSTSSLFRFVSTYSAIEDEATTLGAKNEEAMASSQSSIANFVNLNTIGNATRTDSTNEDVNDDSAQMGGLIFVKAPAVTLNIKNSIIKSYLINAYMEQRLTNINIIDSKLYDSYQSIIYGFNGGNLTIKTSELKRAGGPAILLAGEDNRTSIKHITNIVVDKESEIESYITGLEPWFKIYNKTGMATLLKSADPLFRGYFNSTFVSSGEKIEDQLVNAILFNVLNKNENNLTTCQQMMAKMTIDGVVVMDTTGMNDSEVLAADANKNLINSNTAIGKVMFASTHGGVVGDPVGPVDENDPTPPSFLITNESIPALIPTMKADNSENKKDYLAGYVYGMSLVMSYYALPAA